MDATLFSIGHGTKEINEFLSELRSFDIRFLIDVRSTPSSKWAPLYNQVALTKSLQSVGIRYYYMGDVIGGRPNNDSCYDTEGYISYKKMAEVPSFKKGLLRLVNANQKKIRVAIMCSESDPAECHRSKLIGRELYDKYQIDMKHIIAPNKIILENKVISQLSNWEPDNDVLFPVPLPYFRSRKSYKDMSILNEPYL